MRRRFSLSIHQKLVGLIVTSMLAVVAFLAIYQSSQQIGAMTSSLRRRAETYGSVMAPQVTSAIAFSDKETAREVLRSVDADADVTSVALYGESGAKLYASGKPTIASATALHATAEAVFDEGARIAVVTPVTSVEGPRGALVIELSTASLREARRRILWLAIVTAIGALACGVALAWQLARRIARRLRAIANVATSVARGNLDHDPLVDANADEIGALATAFNAMLDQIKQHHERLERLVAERTAQLEERTAEMQLVFDHVDQGLMIVEVDGTIAAERSAAVDRWLGAVPASANLHAYVELFAPQRAAWFALQWDALREDILPLEISLAQLPARFDVGDRNLEFAYQPLSDGGRLRILIVVTDVTARELRRAAERDEREISTLVARMARGRSAFLAFHAEATSYVEIVKTAALGDTGFRRAVHTLKGVCGLEGLESIAAMCHELETAVAEGDDTSATATCGAIATRWDFVTDKLRPLMDVVADRIDVTRGDLARFTTAVTHGAPRGELVDIVESWADERVAVRLQRFAEDAGALAQRLGKAPLTVTVEVDPALRLPARWAPFWAAFVHAIRNAIDHGVAAPEARTRDRAGELVLRAKHESDRIAIEVEDFGAGIEWAAIERIARAKGLPAATPADLEAALFADGISTREVATETSGRGVGMAVLREACERSGGFVAVSSRPGCGTTLTFSWPWPSSYHLAHQLAV